MYHNEGIEQKYGKSKKEPRSTKDMSYEEVRALKEELKAQYGDIGND